MTKGGLLNLPPWNINVWVSEEGISIWRCLWKPLHKASCVAKKVLTTYGHNLPLWIKNPLVPEADISIWLQRECTTHDTSEDISFRPKLRSCFWYACFQDSINKWINAIQIQAIVWCLSSWDVTQDKIITCMASLISVIVNQAKSISLNTSATWNEAHWRSDITVASLSYIPGMFMSLDLWNADRTGRLWPQFSQRTLLLTDIKLD